MDRRTLAIVLIVAGIALALVSVLADPLGLGSTKNEGFGGKQIFGLVVGLALAGYGVLQLRRPRRRRRRRRR
jgi:membrane associated rhomboid family serine protease